MDITHKKLDNIEEKWYNTSVALKCIGEALGCNCRIMYAIYVKMFGRNGKYG